MDWNAESIVGVGSAVIAVVSLLLNWLVVSRQTKLQSEELKIQMEEDVIAWAQQAIDVLSEGLALADGRGRIYAGDEARRAAHDIAHRLSSLADRGRLFFPNELIGDFGAANEGAFQGVRPPIIDALVFASCAVQSIDPAGADPDRESHAILIKARRLAVSEAQNAIDPRRRKKIQKALIEGRKDDATPSEQVVEELHAALARRLPDSPVVLAWARSRAVLNNR